MEAEELLEDYKKDTSSRTRYEDLVELISNAPEGYVFNLYPEHNKFNIEAKEEDES